MADNSLSLGGIYAIVHRISGKRYIGSAVKFRNRFKEHRSKLNRGAHHSPKLQNAWAKYGAEAFDFVVLEVVSDLDRLIEIEQRWLDSEGAVRLGYNICPVAGSTKGRLASPETKERMRRARSNVSDETRAKMSAARKGRRHSPEHRAMMSAAHKGKVVAPEHIEKLQAGRRAPAAIDKWRVSRAGYTPSAEARAKVAEKLRGRIVSDETREKIREAWRRRKAAARAAE